MTNLFRRDLVASLLMRAKPGTTGGAEATDTQSDHQADHVVEVGMSGRQSGVSGET